MRVKIVEEGEDLVSSPRIEEIIEGTEINGCYICNSKDVASVCKSNPEVKYCSEEHQSMHESDDGDPYPFTVKFNEEVGRYMVASRDIQPGEIIFQEEPLAYGPNHSSLPTCLECMRRVDEPILCPRCNLPLCDEMCGFGEEHAKECSIFSKLSPKLTVESMDKRDPIYWSITTVRALTLKKTDPLKYDIIKRMMDHNAEHEKAGDYWEIYKKQVADFLVDRCSSLEATVDEVLHIIGVLDVNSVKIHGPSIGEKLEQYPGHALYPLTSLLSHSCISNSKTILKVDYSVECRAVVYISAGTEITKQYVSPLETTNRRRSRISNNWFFDCKCDRCRDPTENGSFLSATRCLRCVGEGTILPSNPLDPSSEWLCNNCHFKTNGAAVDKLTEYFEAKMKESGNSIEFLEELLIKAVKLFHPNHYVATMIRIVLNEAYVDLALRVGDGNQIPLEVHMRRKELLDHIHQVIELVDPGLSRRRGLSIFEASTCHLQLGRQLHDANRFHTQDFIQLIEAEIDSLKEGLECLKHAREGTRESNIHYKMQGAIYEAEYTLKYLRSISSKNNESPTTEEAVIVDEEGVIV
ncbi:SET domain-containing protein SmydA-8 [Lepeophtheirus salmonis]|uniref:SET domain-containing protein SmydA-8 n=1 Tax=Lepeophtheirus salmonis TaxID=72036 RepID=UPI001AE53E59|nr:SET domain-containing protein SmydA-8-like [Lepeophtheirus salmonis]